MARLLGIVIPMCSEMNLEAVTASGKRRSSGPPQVSAAPREPQAGAPTLRMAIPQRGIAGGCGGVAAVPAIRYLDSNAPD
jgi:hypothetical protein